MDVLRSVPTHYPHNDEGSADRFFSSDDEVVPSLDHAFDIFAEYDVELHQLDQFVNEDDLKTMADTQYKKVETVLTDDDILNPVKPPGIDREFSGRRSNKSPGDGDFVGLKLDPNHNQVDVGNPISAQIGYLRNKLIANFRPGIPIIAEDSSDLETAEDAEKHCAQIPETNAAFTGLDGENDDITGSFSDKTSPRTNSQSANGVRDADMIDSPPQSCQSTSVSGKSCLESHDDMEDTAPSNNYTPRRRHSLATIPDIHVSRIVVSTDKQHSVSKIDPQLETDVDDVSIQYSMNQTSDSHINDKNAEYQPVSERASSLSSSSDETKERPSLLTVPDPQHLRRQRRYSLADISKMGLSMLEDPSFAKEIRQHQLLSVNEEKAPPCGEHSDEADNADESNSVTKPRDLTSPAERAKYLRRRRASHGAIAPILPNLHLPRSPRSSMCDIPSTDPVTSAPAINVTNAHDDDDKPTKQLDEDTMSAAEDRNRLLAARRSKRRSSWACTGSHPTMNPMSTMEFLRKNNSYGDIESPSTDSRDPYRLTVHFITDPGQSDKLRNLLMPLTKAVVPRLAIFNYVERSMNACTPRVEEDDSTTIPALGIVVFLQEEVGAERLTNTQGYLQEEPWALHHRSELGPNAVPYPTNNQDFYAYADDMPLWAVRQVHFGKDRLRCQLFVTDEHWNNTIQLYATILGHSVQYLKDDFCYFQVYSNTKRNLEIQLSLKKLPVGYKAGPLDDAILQFKIDDIGALVPLLPNVCSPISHKRWQTTDFDGNKILLYRPNKPYCLSPRHDDSDGSVSTTSDNERPPDKHRRGRHPRHHKRKSKIISTAV